jgi:excisionase family DNA binding protein
VAARLLTIPEMADYLHVSRAQAYLLIWEDGFPLITMGPKLHRVKLDALDCWIATKTAATDVSDLDSQRG